VICGGDGNDRVDGGTGKDRVWGAAGRDQINGGGDDDKLTGDSGSDVLLGAGGSDRLVAGTGDDVLTGGAGADRHKGGAGTDTVSFSDHKSPVSADLDGLADDGSSGERDLVGSDVENLVGGASADRLEGNPASNKLEGGGGDDALIGGVGADVLAGGSGTDTVSYEDRAVGVSADLDGQADDGTAGEGDLIATDVEQLTGGTGSDALTGGPGTDVLAGLAGDDVLAGGGAGDAMHGGPGFDTVTYTDRATAVSADLDGQPDDGSVGEGDQIAADVEQLVGGSGGDTLVGGPGPDALNGGPGADTLRGADGNDHLDGADGDDQLSGQPGNDTLLGGAGDDTLSGDEGVDTVDGGAGINLCMRDPEEPEVATCKYDVNAPELVDFSFTPTSVDATTGPVTLTFTARLTDDGVGPAGNGYTSSPSQVRFTNASGQNITAMFMAESRISGTARDGIYQSTATLPQGAAPGAWTVSSFLLVDQVGNTRWLQASHLQTAGLPTTFTNG
jgi:Ca2+-binding RTX toxin-like protein